MDLRKALRLKQKDSNQENMFKLGLMEHQPMTLGDADICVICLGIGFKNDNGANEADYYVHTQCVEELLKRYLYPPSDIRHKRSRSKCRNIDKKILNQHGFKIPIVNKLRLCTAGIKGK